MQKIYFSFMELIRVIIGELDRVISQSEIALFFSITCFNFQKPPTVKPYFANQKLGCHKR